ncbi:MAG: hypothetical protein FWC89_00715 [Defluviitaleaceae bacterium]|nr:hypothetical protein [Defluviitaleaceae bacterium]
MNPQIEQLRTAFNGYNNAQKKQFIDNLKTKLQTHKSPEYSKFLNECMQKYNSAIRIANRPSDIPIQVNTKTASALVQTPVAHMPAPQQVKQKNPLKGVVVALSLIVVLLVVGIGFFMLTNSDFSNTPIAIPTSTPTEQITYDISDNHSDLIGSWQYRNDQTLVFMSWTHTFDADGRFIYMFRLVTDTGGVLNTDGVSGYVLWGTWYAEDDNLTIHLEQQAQLNSRGNVNTAAAVRVMETWNYSIQDLSANSLTMRRGGHSRTYQRID